MTAPRIDAAQRERAATFRRLHDGPRILVLPNAWDAASARVFESAGFPAIATTSAGVANSLGYADGQQLPVELLIDAVRRITATVQIPVSADFEWGYSDDPETVCDTVAALIEAGAVGVNVEDHGDAQALVAKVRALRARGWPLFVNARADTYLYGGTEPAALFDETVRRLRAYEEAGADGLFAPGLVDPATITRLLGEIRLPLNVLAFPGCPSPRELDELGVRRVTVGSGAMRATVGVVQRIARELLDGTGYTTYADAPSHGEVNAMFKR